MTRSQVIAFIDMASSGTRLTQKHKVYNAFRHMDCKTLEQAHQRCAPMKMASVSGRLSELLDMGLIREWTTVAGNFETLHTIDQVNEQIARRDHDRFKKWEALGKKEGYFELMNETHFAQFYAG
mgnify:FL=1